MEKDKKIIEMIELLRDEELVTNQGMPEELFLLVSSLVPLVNVDLLVCNEKNQVLLAKRKDDYYENSWHIPGGCIHFGESMLDCVHATAIREVGADVIVHGPEPIAIRDVIRGNNLIQKHPRERGHNIAVLFRCSVLDNYVINNFGLSEEDNGYLKWFDYLPDSFMKIQEVYLDVLEQWVR